MPRYVIISLIACVLVVRQVVAVDKVRLGNKLRAICGRGYGNDHCEDELLDILGYRGARNKEQIEAMLIKAVRDFFGYNINADILLMALRLLRGYRHIPEIGERRRRYVRDSNFLRMEHSTLFATLDAADANAKNDVIDKATERLRKHEDKLVRDLVNAISRIENMSSFVEDIDGYIRLAKRLDSGKPVFQVVYPVPSYLSTHDIGEELPPADNNEPYILTPNAPRWDNPRILGRESQIAELCGELQLGTPHLQLTGMGGIGKTETLNKIFVYFAAHREEHYFDYIGLLSYSESMDATLSSKLAYPGVGDTDKIWSYLRDICERNSVLLLIDDNRTQRLGQAYAFDASFNKLFTINATVLLASRTLLNGFEERRVESLSLDDCMLIFFSQRYPGRPLYELPVLSKEDKARLQGIIESRAGNNSLVVNRLGAMMYSYGWDISTLAKRLKNKHFDIRKEFDSDEKLQEENGGPLRPGRPKPQPAGKA